jgi:hypothetical protein
VLLQRPEKYGAGAAFIVDPARRRLRVLGVDLGGRVSSGDARIMDPNDRSVNSSEGGMTPM